MDRSLLLLLAITVAFIFYVKPARENINLLQTRLDVLNSQIAAQENIKRQNKNLGGYLKTTGIAASANEGYLYPAAESTSMAMVDLQDFVKNSATANRQEIVASTWGEPVDDPKTGQIRLPMTFTVKGAPSDLDAFLRKLLHDRHFIKIERATVSRYQDQQLMFNFSMVAFKRIDRHD
jgi:hypothetical protein